MGQNPRVLFLRHEDYDRKAPGGVLPGGQTHARRGHPWARAWGVSGGPAPPPTPPLRPYILHRKETLSTQEEIHEELRSRRQRRTHLGGF